MAGPCYCSAQVDFELQALKLKHWGMLNLHYSILQTFLYILHVNQILNLHIRTADWSIWRWHLLNINVFRIIRRIPTALKQENSHWGFLDVNQIWHNRQVNTASHKTLLRLLREYRF